MEDIFRMVLLGIHVGWNSPPKIYDKILVKFIIHENIFSYIYVWKEYITFLSNKFYSLIK